MTRLDFSSFSDEQLIYVFDAIDVYDAECLTIGRSPDLVLALLKEMETRMIGNEAEREAIYARLTGSPPPGATKQIFIERAVGPNGRPFPGLSFNFTKD